MPKVANKSLFFLSIVITFFLIASGMPKGKLDTRSFGKGIVSFPEDIEGINSLNVSSENATELAIPEDYPDYQIFLGKNLRILN